MQIDFSGATSPTDEINAISRNIPIATRDTYDFEGNSQVLDHILISPAIAARGFAYDVVHVNSEFADQASDHEPQVARVKTK